MILFGYAFEALLACAVGFLIASVLWHEGAKVRPFAIACGDCEGSGSAADAGGFDGEDCPTCFGSAEQPDDEWMPYDPDRQRDWDIADAQEAM